MTTCAPVKPKNSATHKRIELPSPKDADQLLALSKEQVDRLYYETTIRLGQARQRRGSLLRATPANDPALSCVNGEIGRLGSLIFLLQARRTFFRISHRHAIGAIPQRAEAIARACDALLPRQLHRKIQDEADRLMAQARADLATDLAAVAPTPACGVTTPTTA